MQRQYTAACADSELKMINEALSGWVTYFIVKVHTF